MFPISLNIDQLIDQLIDQSINIDFTIYELFFYDKLFLGYFQHKSFKYGPCKKYFVIGNR